MKKAFRILMALCCIYFFVRAALKFVHSDPDGGFFLIIALGFGFVSVMLKLASK